MKFNCPFSNPDTGEHKTILVALTAQQVRSVEAVRALGKDGTDYAHSYALQQAYREVPRGFAHSEPPKEMALS
jgi:hypothetical protein